MRKILTECLKVIIKSAVAVGLIVEFITALQLTYRK